MNTANFVYTQDRLDISSLSAVASGTPFSRDASKSMVPREGSGTWSAKPTVIVAGASMARGTSGVTNPYSSSRMKDTLHGRPTSTPGFGGPQGNWTSSKTVLGPSSRGPRTSGYLVPQNNAKRVKVDHEEIVKSKFFPTGRASGKGKGKGKETDHPRGSTASDPETLSDSEDVGQVVEVTPKIHRPNDQSPKSESPDPIDVIDTGTSPSRPKHPFDAPSKRGPDRRLAEDGHSTLRLQARQKQRTTPSERDVVELSSDIESASAFDDEVPGQGRTTPNGRSTIPQGVVKGNVRKFEASNKPATRRVLDMQPVTNTPFIDLKQKGDRKPRSSIKNSMRGKNQKSPPQLKQASLSAFGRSANENQVDSIASSSGFATTRQSLAQKAQPIPLEAWSMGCGLQNSQVVSEPAAWLSIHLTPRSNTFLLKVVRNPLDDKNPLYTFHLDRDFSSITYSDPTEDWESDSTIMIQLQSTQSLKVTRSTTEFFKAGDRHSSGAVTFKIMTQHPNMFNDEDRGRRKYAAVMDVLLREIKDSHNVLKPNIASKTCWSKVEMAAEYRPTTPTTRSKAPSSRQSPASAGSSKHPTALDTESASASAPQSRMYGSNNERRQTRQSTRSTRASPTPDLDELILVYPFSGTGAVNVTRGDLKRLDPGQYLNDTIIEFGLKVWLDELRKNQPELAEQVHVFNSFFYKKLNAKKNVAETYASVRKWTSKVDIFAKKYIIVPINENFHWYLAIIENPKNMLHPPPPPMQGSAPQTRQTRKRKRESAATEAEVEVEAQAEAEAEKLLDEPAEGKSTSKDSSKQPSEPPAPTLPDTMAVDGPESEGEVEVENLLHATQSCSIGEPEGDRDHASEDKVGSTTDVSEEIENLELQYPMSDEPMDVDATSAPGADVEVEKKPPDRDLSEPFTADEDDVKEVATDAKPGELSAHSKEPTKEEGLADDAEPVASAAGAPEYPICYIYTFDSLGSRHIAAGKHLAHYLQHEAADKKKYPIQDTCVATYKAAKAPMQPNFCDCGVFVLAFVEAFMRDPEAASEAIRRSQLSWWDASLADLRETFRDRTILLSEEWKKERAAKEGAKVVGAEDKSSTESVKAKPNGKARPSPEVVPDSEEDEIEISAVHIPPKPASRGGKKGNATKAARLRG